MRLSNLIYLYKTNPTQYSTILAQGGLEGLCIASLQMLDSPDADAVRVALDVLHALNPHLVDTEILIRLLAMPHDLKRAQVITILKRYSCKKIIDSLITHLAVDDRGVEKEVLALIRYFYSDNPQTVAARLHAHTENQNTEIGRKAYDALCAL